MSADGVTGPWWVSFAEMLTPEELEEIGVSEDRGAVQCITRLASAYASAMAARSCNHCGAQMEPGESCDASIQEANHAWMEECKVAEARGREAGLEEAAVRAIRSLSRSTDREDQT